MQFIGEKDVTVRELERLARTLSNLRGMERWGYIEVEPNPEDSRHKPPRSDWVVRPTEVGRRAQDVWRPMVGVVESRWRERCGGPEIERLRETLRAVDCQLDGTCPTAFRSWDVS